MALNIVGKRESPLWQIIEYLQRNGSATIKELEDLLHVTTTAVRQHLNTLQAEGYIERRVVHAGVGRPHHAYFTTPRVPDTGLMANGSKLFMRLFRSVIGPSVSQRSPMFNVRLRVSFQSS